MRSLNVVREYTRGPVQTVMIAQRLAGVFGAEQPALAQYWNDLLGEQVESARQPRRHDIESVRSSVFEPSLDVVGDLFRRSGDHPMAARAGKALHQLSDGRLLAIDDADDEFEAACNAAGAVRVDQMPRERTVEVEAGEI
jgi:hypothetical protein